MKNSIKDAYDSINISEESKNRIYSSLFSEKDETPQNVVYIKSHRKKLLRVISIAAAVTVLVVFAATAVAETQYDLGNYIFKNRQSETDSAEVSSEISSEETVERIPFSLQGAVTSPEFLASYEWEEYLQSEVYDPDGSILDKVEAELRKHPDFDKEDENGNPIILTYEGIPYNKDYLYSCYTTEMCEKLDEICEKYSLKLADERYTYYHENTNYSEPSDLTTAEFYEMANSKPFIRESNNDFTQIIDSGYIYNNGTFRLSGTVKLKSDEATYKKSFNYEMIRTVKGYISTIHASIRNPESYEQWTYTTSNGVPLLLIYSEEMHNERIIANLDNSVVVIEPWEDDALDPNSDDYNPKAKQKTKRDLELFAETFDFAAIS